ncbi:MAG TPA: hypothetical protein VHD37_00330 [Candidatus Paceibacterota bacterium]|nr:hypothetical protein [Candidatus Paceibacterota bacterium]
MNIDCAYDAEKLAEPRVGMVVFVPETDVNESGLGVVQEVHRYEAASDSNAPEKMTGVIFRGISPRVFEWKEEILLLQPQLITGAMHLSGADAWCRMARPKTERVAQAHTSLPDKAKPRKAAPLTLVSSNP